MTSRLLHLYHRAPSPARTLAASARGWYLRAWRYGPETERLVAEAIERESWGLDRWRRWQEERLAFVLHRAATRVPYYRSQWATRRRGGDRASWEILENWPVLEKEALRRNPLLFIADDADPRKMFREHTSGTSGMPLQLWWSRKTVRAWYALFEARWRRWYGVSRHDRWATLGGQLVTPVARHDPPFWVWNAASHQLYMSSYHLAPEFLPAYFEALRRYRVRYLYGYSSSLHALAQRINRGSDDDLKLTVAIANAEPLLEHQRETIERGLGCPVRETYGMSEIVAAAGECDAGRLHLWPEVGCLEVMQHGERVLPGEPGEFICTGLLNADMPLVRYRVGDRGAEMDVQSTCDCGRTLPALAYIEGRIDDVLYSPDGRRVGRLDPVFKARLAVREAQVIQDALDRVRVRYVPAPGFTSRDARSIVDGLRARMGRVEVVMEEVECIPRGPNGKFRAVVCNLAPDDLPP